MRDMHGHVHIGARFDINMDVEEIVDVLSHIFKICCRVTWDHHVHASEGNC